MEQITIRAWRYDNWKGGYISEIRIENAATNIVYRTRSKGPTPEIALANLKSDLGGEWPANTRALERCGAYVEVLTIGEFPLDA